MAYTSSSSIVSRGYIRATGDAVSKTAKTTTGNSGWIDVGNAHELIAQLHSDAGTGTAPTLDVKFQTSFNGADANAIDVPTGSFTQVTTVASQQVKSIAIFHPFVKVSWTIAGTTPSFNFGVYLTGRE